MMWTVNLKFFYVKNKNEEEWDGFSSFDAHLFSERKRNAVQTAKMLCVNYGEDVIDKNTICK